MRKIAVLDQHTIDKIAAGEVVERPSSVVKELVENAIDAGATAITVEIAGGGKKLIRITDNGSGMDYEQVPTAFLRHATSKIVKIEDLETIASLGFRGEALSSIAAVSQVELITKTPSNMSGVRYVIEGGIEKSLEELGAPEGTTFLIRNLFFNTPVRSKFLKSDMTEANYISALMEQLALSHPEISFKYIQDKQVKLHTSGNYSVKDVIYNIYGRDITKSLLEVKFENDFMKIEGFVGKPEISRGNRTYENYYINGRYIKNKIITKAIEDGYKGFLMQHKFPFVSLHIEMTGNDLDVNVHPSKMEVRFARTLEVYDAIYDSVRRALTKREMIPQVPVKEEKTDLVKEVLKPSEVPEPFETSRRPVVTNTPSRPQPVRESDAVSGANKTFSASFTSEKPAYNQQAQHKPYGSFERNFLQKESMLSYKVKPSDFVKPEKKDFQENTPDEDLTKSVSIIPKTVEMNKPLEKSSSPVNESICLKEETNYSVNDDFTSKVSVSSVSVEENASTETEIVETPQKPGPQEEPKQLELFEEKLLAPESRIRHQLIGQLFDTYWLVQFDDNFYIIDQHAAHEKIYYERFVKEFKEQTIDSQYISPPIIVTLNLQEEALLKANEKYFKDFGFEIDHFGGKEYCISAVPANLYGKAEADIFLEMLDHLAGEGDKNALDLFTARLATMACKAAVKGNHQMSAAEADQLIDELLTLENPYHCPHGRPTIVSMTKTEIEKKFKRIV